MILNFKNVYVNGTSTVAGPYEAKGPLRTSFDKKYQKDLYCGEKSFEEAEVKLLEDSLKILLQKTKKEPKDIDLVIAGDLLNQITSSCYSALKMHSPFLGIYTACATSIEGILIGSTFIDSLKIHTCVAATSSHNMSSEKQFRNPTEYGAPKPATATFTSTGGASILLSDQPSKIRVVNGMIGTIMNYDQKDPFHMGAVMAPAAADTLYKYFRDTKTKPDDYDLILTGDLGIYGKEILRDLLRIDHQIVLGSNYNDCGVMLYDLEKQKEVNAGGSGPVCSALVNYGSIMKKLEEGVYKKVLLVATGALFSPTFAYQKKPILSIANLVCLEAIA